MKHLVIINLVYHPSHVVDGVILIHHHHLLQDNDYQDVHVDGYVDVDVTCEMNEYNTDESGDDESDRDKALAL